MAKKPTSPDKAPPAPRRARTPKGETPAALAKKQAVATEAAAAVAATARKKEAAAKPARRKRATPVLIAVPDSLAPICGRLRVVIEAVTPQVDGGRFACKRVVGEAVCVEADVFTDGHDRVAADLWFRHEDDPAWHRVPMQALVNDRWRGCFTVEKLGRYQYTLSGWVDHFATWRNDLRKRFEAGQDLAMAFAIGARYAREAADREKVEDADAQRLREWADGVERDGASTGDSAREPRYQLAMDEAVAALMRAHPDPDSVERLAKLLCVTVERERARYSSWYEFFPRSAAAEARHGSFKDAEARLSYIAEMGFDVVYLPPIHPIGAAFRKGRNNSTSAEPGEPGSPWAIGSDAGGHKAIHPELGSLEDFHRLVAKTAELGMEIALDIAFQVSPDHPYVREHPEWFLSRPDGSIQYAENPPKKYQDIYPFHFETDDWPALWLELKSIFEFWVEQGVRIFRVDNPHTKSFRFWEWCLAELKSEHPELIFLSEAFTRPKPMHRLAKLGYSQSYTYFTWRNGKQELTEYFTELSQDPSREYFRPNVWPNTPDILADSLQVGGRPAHVQRLILATTLAANYGIYGPAFELFDSRPREPGAEEYLDSEKYQLRQWDLAQAGSLKDLIAKLNAIRRRYPALQRDWGLRFHDIDNDQLLAYSKVTEAGGDAVLTVVNLDLHHVQSGWLSLPLARFGLAADEQYPVEDLLTGARYLWQGTTNFVSLDPHSQPAHILRLQRRVHREQDFQGYR